MSDISKYSVVDPRIMQQKPKFAVEKGAVSITNQTFSAIASSSSQQTYQVQVPSENVFVDRAVDWVNTAKATISMTYTSAPGANVKLVSPGIDFSLAPFPMNQSVSTMQATINDQSLSINMSDVLPQILRLADLAASRKQRTCPTMLDRYFSVQSAATYPNSPVGGYGAGYTTAEIPNGAWGDVSFEAGTNTALSNGLPVTVGAQTTSFSFNVTFTTAEKLVLPPFIFADEYELSCGLFGIQNMQFTMNFNQPGRSFRIAKNSAWSAPPVITWASSNPFSKAQIQTQFLTPNLEVPLPSKSICPWFEFPRYISPSAKIVALPNSGIPPPTSVQSQTITLPMIPDLLIIYVKPQSYSYGGNFDPTQADFVLPITKISLSFDNFSGLLANHSTYELYKMSVNNGLEMDWNEWSGQAWAQPGSSATSKVPLVGGPLVLRPGRDFALSTGQAPNLLGNFTLQFDLTVSNYSTLDFDPGATNPSSTNYGAGVAIYTVTANSGYFETIKGASRILRNVVTEQDILSAPVSEVPQSMERMVGEGKVSRVMGNLASLAKKGMHNYVRS